MVNEKEGSVRAIDTRIPEGKAMAMVVAAAMAIDLACATWTCRGWWSRFGCGAWFGLGARAIL